MVTVSQVTIKTKHVPKKEEFCLEFNLTNEPQMFFDTLRISQFILCKYDNLYWNGMACETDVENRDFKWSSCIHLIKVDHTGQDGFCWVPNTNLITKIDAPSLSTVTGRQYQLTILSQADRTNSSYRTNNKQTMSAFLF